jgi:transglutaminase-like putative cysteine protease
MAREFLGSFVACLVSVLLLGFSSSAQEAPADVLARIPDGYDDAPAVCLLSEVTCAVQTGGQVVVRTHEIIWLRTQDGIGLACPKRIRYQKLSDDIRAVFARTILPSGESVEATAITHTRPRQRPDVVTDDWDLTIGFPRVAPGCIVEYEVEHVSRSWTGPFMIGAPLEAEMPSVELRWAFTDETGVGLRYELRHCDGLDSLVVVQPDPGSIVVEGFNLPAFGDSCACAAVRAPSIVVSQCPSWGALARHLKDRFLSQSDDTEPIRAKALELLWGVTEEEEIVRILFEFARDEIRYLSTVFESSWLQVQPAAETLARGEGNCVTKSALLIALLAEAGIEAHPALVSTTCDLALGMGEVPWYVDGINHAVTAVRLHDGELRLLDPTCWFCSSDDGPGLSATHVWVLSAASDDSSLGELVWVPERTADDWQTETSYDVTMSPDGSVVASGQYIAWGTAALEWQAIASVRTSEECAERVRWLLIPDSRVRSYSMSLQSAIDSVAIDLRLEGPLFGTWKDGEMSVEFLPSIQFDTDLTVAGLPNAVAGDAAPCTTPTDPRRETWMTRLRLPDDIVVVGVPADVSVVTPVASYSATYERLADGTILATRELVIFADGVEADQYANLKRVIDALLLDSQSAVIVRQGGE